MNPAGDSLAVGSRVAYADLGPGIVTGTIWRELKGLATEFLELTIPHLEMTVQVPVVQKADRLRPLVAPEVALDLIEAPAREIHALPDQWPRRQAWVKAQLAEDDPAAWAGVVWAYAFYSGRGEWIGPADRDLLEDASDRLVSELAVAMGRERDEVRAVLDQRVAVIAKPEQARKRRRRRRHPVDAPA